MLSPVSSVDPWVLRWFPSDFPEETTLSRFTYILAALLQFMTLYLAAGSFERLAAKDVLKRSETWPRKYLGDWRFRHPLWEGSPWERAEPFRTNWQRGYGNELPNRR
jgi:hypothetical protein